ncbi:MAG: universal stress protein [Bacteroidetes bacterium]|nr:universal stress protein [Bacteroidota bacterium]
MALTINKILLAFESPQKSSVVINIAAAIAKAHNSEVIALQCSEGNYNIDNEFGQLKLKKIQSSSKHLKDLIQVAETENPDLIIFSVSNNADLNGVLSFADSCKFIDQVEKLVLTIPGNLDNFDFSNIIVPIDTSFETRQKAPFAVSFAHTFNSVLHIIGVSSDSSKDAEVVINNYSRQVSNNFAEKGIDSTIEIRMGGNPSNSTIDYCSNKKAGLIIMMTEQETSFTSFFKGKYSEQMIKLSNIPILSIHPRDLIVSEARL